MMCLRRIVLTLFVAFAHAPAAYGQSEPRPLVSNGTLDERSAAGGLQTVFRQVAAATTDVAWIGYAVPIVDGDHRMCCGNIKGSDCCGGCRLEPGPKSSTTPALPAATTARLESPDTLFVLFRIEHTQLERIRIFSENCRLDAGGRAIHWLTGVRPADSVSLLAGHAAAGSTRRLADGALSAVAMHDEPAALDWLLGAARTGATTHLRGQALFWLSQRAGQRAIGAISEAIDKDPETDVKRQAVFALSQLPPDDGVPRLMAVARTHSNQAVRKQAFFWLGQSKDPRALAFFTSILAR